MLQPIDLRTPPTVMPSDMARFLRRDQCFDTTFSTPEFAAFFALSALEAHDALNNMADDGLVSFINVDSAVETWVLSRDGYFVFQPRAKRLTKEKLKAATNAVLSLTSLLMAEGAVEVSLGGRPMQKKPNGKLLVGIRLSHSPLSLPVDALMVQQVSDALEQAVPGHGYSLLLFENRAPLRLKDRYVVTGKSKGQWVTANPAELDADESEQLAWRATLLQSHGVQTRHDVLQHRLYGRDLPFALLESVASDNHESESPAICERSPMQLQETIGVDPEKFEHWMRFMRSRLGLDSSLAKQVLPFVAAIDYYASTGQFKELCEKVAGAEEIDGCRFEHVFPFYYYDDPAPRGAELEFALLAALQAYRERLVQGREYQQKMKERKQPPDIRYYAAFDTLNFASPRLVGFVRQPASNRASFKQLEDYWTRAVDELALLPAEYLSTNHFNSGYLSLDYRPATELEIAAFDHLSKTGKMQLRFVVALDSQAFAMGVNHPRKLESLGPLPEHLARASLGRPIRPRLISSRDWTIRDGVPLPVAISEAPTPVRDAFECNIVDVDAVPMQEFARKAALNPCIDPVVLTTGLNDTWEFSSKAESWGASLRADSWSVAFSGNETSLHVVLRLDEMMHAQQLAPYSGPLSYEGCLGSLLSVMERFLWMRSHFDVDAQWARVVDQADGEGSTPTKFEWFVQLAGEVLTGWAFGLNDYFRDHHTSWPPLTVNPEAKQAY